MRYICAFLMIIVFLLTACKKEEDAPRKSEIATEQNLPKIVAFGNSLTAGLGLAGSETYPALLQKKLTADGYHYEVINAGVSGDTTAGGLRRIDWSMEGNVKFVILELGGNDILRGQPVSMLKQNLGQIIEKAQARGAKVILAGMEAPTNSGSEYRKQVHEAYQELAKKYDVAFIPFFLKDVAGSEKLIQEDGTHPNEQGTKLIAETVYKTLKPLL
jgi:acyl-CoA thioesterase-1